MAREQREILLVEDNPGDVRLTQEILKGTGLQTQVKVVYDGEEALHYLMQSVSKNLMPDIIILDLNIPRRNGLEVLEVLQAHPKLVLVPVVVLTSSEAEHDINNSYAQRANCYITKPVGFDEYFKVITKIEQFWFTIAKLPS